MVTNRIVRVRRLTCAAAVALSVSAPFQRTQAQQPQVTDAGVVLETGEKVGRDDVAAFGFAKVNLAGQRVTTC